MNDLIKETFETMNEMGKQIDRYKEVLAVITRWMPKLPQEFTTEILQITMVNKDEQKPS